MATGDGGDDGGRKTGQSRLKQEPVDNNVFKVTDAFLKDFADGKIKAFLADLENNQSIVKLKQFADAVGGGHAPGDYSKIRAGSDKFPEATQLQNQFKNLATSIYKEITAFRQTMMKASIDLLTFHTHVDAAEQENAVTASALMAGLQDVLGTSGDLPAPSTPPDPSAPSALPGQPAPAS